jgi:hypothetical protein
MGSVPLLILLLTGGPDGQTPPGPQQLVPTSTTPNTANDPVDPVTGAGRLKWAVISTIGPGSLFVGAAQAGFGNLTNRPPEYREGAEGFGKRFSLRLSSVGTSNLMEASLGAIWGEDPRYHRSHEITIGGHFAYALRMTIMAQRSDGSLEPAYARYIAYAGSNAISDAWRPDSQVTVGSTMTRIGERFAGRLLGNIFQEFWPEIKQHTFLKNH